MTPQTRSHQPSPTLLVVAMASTILLIQNLHLTMALILLTYPPPWKTLINHPRIPPQIFLANKPVNMMMRWQTPNLTPHHTELILTCMTPHLTTNSLVIRPTVLAML